MKYASTTTVSPERSRLEIERTLSRYGAEQFAYGSNPNGAMIAFQFAGRLIRFTLSKPKILDIKTPTGRKPHSPKAAHDKAIRQQWRALSLAIKAKLELVDSGIVSFEIEFQSYTVLPNGQTAGEWLAPQIDAAYNSHTMPSLLPAPKGDR